MKLILILLFSVDCILINAQIPKKIILEHFTNTKCSICANRNPGLLNNLKQHPNINSISIYPSSPYASCPLSALNKIENDARTNYYSIYGNTPRIVINGAVIPSANNYADTSIFTPYLATSSISIQIIQTIIGDSMKADIVMKRVSNSQPNENAILTAIIIEDTVFLNGGNGELMHFNVAKKFLTTSVGQSLTLPTNVGDSMTIAITTFINTNWAINRIKTAAILQNGTTKNLLQSEVSSTQKKYSTLSSINENSNQSNILSPNPAGNTISISNLNDTSNWTILNSNGKEVLKMTSKRAKELDISSLKSGIYFFKLDKNNSSEIIKFIVIK